MCKNIFYFSKISAFIFITLPTIKNDRVHNNYLKLNIKITSIIS